MPLSLAQRRILEEWMRSKAIVTCPCCGQGEWRFAEAAYVRALLEEDAEDLLEAAGVVKIPCDNCGYLVLFDAETIGIRGLWAEGRDLQHAVDAYRRARWLFFSIAAFVPPSPRWREGEFETHKFPPLGLCRCP